MASQATMLSHFTQSNPGQTWNLVNKLMGKSHTKYMPNLITCPLTQNRSSDVQQISNIFNQYFASVDSNFAKKIQQIDYNNYTNKYISESMFIQPVCAEEIFFHIDTQDNKKSNDTCDIPVHFHIIKLSKHIIAPVLTTIFNNCITEGIYPDALKVAKVIPMHKNGDTSNPSNYRPISILPHFSKIFEKILLEDLQSFLDKNNILCPNQFGFRKGFSTVHALMSLNDIITSKPEENLYTCAIF